MAPPEASPDIPEAAPEPAATSGGEVALSPRSFTPGLEVAGLLKASILAFLAGFILNFMPCVLPVVSLKLSSLLAVCGHGEAVSRHRMLREHNLFFALGILAYFLALSLLLWFAGLAWGQIFQSTALTLALTVVLFALTMSLFGVFHLPVIDLKVPEKATGNSRNGAFVTGVLATLLATPCSGPFLGGVLAWTLLQPLFTVMAVFTCLGLGMALPYLMLAVWPRLVRFMPRPGDWMVSLEQGMGFLLAGSCIYFLTILPQEKLVAALFALWTTGLAPGSGAGSPISPSPAAPLRGARPGRAHGRRGHGLRLRRPASAVRDLDAVFPGRVRVPPGPGKSRPDLHRGLVPHLQGPGAHGP
jgi:thiol:disulfide interchange protein DsbD